MSSGPEPRLQDQEPFATIREHPRRFAWGGITVFAVSLGAGFLLAGWSLSVGIAVQILLQTGGLLWLYLPVSGSRRTRDR